MTMRKLLTILAAALFALAPITASAGNTTWQSVFSSFKTGTAIGPGSLYLAMGGTVGYAGQIPVVRTLSATSDLSGSVVTLLAENGDSTTTDAAYSSGGTVLPVTATTLFEATTPGAGSYVAIVDNANKKFEVNRVSSISAGVSLNLITATLNTYANGSKVYELTSLGTIPVGSATITWPTAMLVGLSGKVLGWSVNGTSSCSMNYIAGDYVSAQGK